MYKLHKLSGAEHQPPRDVQFFGECHNVFTASSATTEFQKILNHSGIVKICETGALPCLGLAQAYVLQGDITKAKVAYQDFLTLWKDADPDIPILRQVMQEYARINRTDLH